MQDTIFRTPSGTPVPAVTAEEMREIDRIAMEKYELGLLQMMENAGRALATVTHRWGTEPVCVVAGNGGNGGGGLACARHLINHDVETRIILDRSRETLSGAADRQACVLQEMNVPFHDATDERLVEAQSIVDALIGYGLAGTVRGDAGTLVERMNESAVPVISLDVPTGRDATHGEPKGVAVDPDGVMTLALPKSGLAGITCPIELADIGIPATAFERCGMSYSNPFGTDDTVPLRSIETTGSAG